MRIIGSSFRPRGRICREFMRVWSVWHKNFKSFVEIWPQLVHGFAKSRDFFTPANASIRNTVSEQNMTPPLLHDRPALCPSRQTPMLRITHPTTRVFRSEESCSVLLQKHQSSRDFQHWSVGSGEGGRREHRIAGSMFRPLTILKNKSYIDRQCKNGPSPTTSPQSPPTPGFLDSEVSVRDTWTSSRMYHPEKTVQKEHFLLAFTNTAAENGLRLLFFTLLQKMRILGWNTLPLGIKKGSNPNTLARLLHSTSWSLGDSYRGVGCRAPGRRSWFR